MAVGLAILTAYGSTTIDRLYDELYATPDGCTQFIPASLRDRPLRDPLVVAGPRGRGRRARRRRSWSGCSSWPGRHDARPSLPALALGGRGGAPGAAEPRTGRPRAPPEAATSMASSPRTRPRTLSRGPHRRAARPPASPRPTSDGAPGADPRRRVRRGRAPRRGRRRRPRPSCRSSCGRPDASIWVDLVPPSPTQVARVGQALELHPLIVEDVLEGNQRSKIEITDGLIQIVLFNLTYGEKVLASEIDFVLGPRFLLTVHDGLWDPRATNHLRAGIAPILRARPGPPAVGARRRRGRRLLPVRRPAGRGHRRRPGRGGPARDPSTVEQLFALKRELSRSAARSAPFARCSTS